MRILLLAPHPFFSQRGTPIAEKMLLEVLAAQGHEIEVLTFPEGEDPKIPNCRIIRVPAPAWTRGMRPGFSLKKLAGDAVMLGACLARVRRGRYDVVHAVEESAFIALLCKWLFGVPYVYDMDSGLAQQMVDRFPVLARVRRLLDACERLAICGSCGTLAVCGSLEEQARACHPGGLVARLEDVSLLGDGEGRGRGGDPGLCPPEWRQDPKVLYVGNLQAYQGIDLLLAAFAHALSLVPRARLVVVGGEAAEIACYRGEAERLGIAGHVLFAGARPVESLGDCLRQADLLVSPRVHGTNTPMKVYSYLDSGRALVATRLPTHTQVLDDEVALLVDPEPGPMGEGLARLLQDEVLRERLAAGARRLARAEFTPEAFRRKLLAFYNAVAERIGEDANDGETARLEARHPGPG
ncbi:MAG TPA: glycosyltransferase family 4 protein [Thermoanaerobaculia bacterium]|nr:glycosyltransferase family 4 protein [Thermoanaerobaculia bacterium]